MTRQEYSIKIGQCATVASISTVYDGISATNWGECTVYRAEYFIQNWAVYCWLCSQLGSMVVVSIRRRVLPSRERLISRAASWLYYPPPSSSPSHHCQLSINIVLILQRQSFLVGKLVGSITFPLFLLLPIIANQHRPHFDFLLASMRQGICKPIIASFVDKM